MKINKKELLTILKKLDIVRDHNSLANKNVLFNQDKITAINNCGVVISCPFETGYTFYINPEKVIEYLGKVKQDQIELNYENNILTLMDDKTDLTLKTVNNDVKKSVIPTENNWKKLPDDFFKGIQHAFFSAVELTYTKFNYIGNFLFLEDKIFTTDNKRLSEYKLSKSMGTFTLNFKAVSLLIKIQDLDTYALLEEENKIIFKSKDNTIVSCLYANIEAPQYQKFMEIPENNIEINFINQLIESLDFCEILNKDVSTEDKKIYFSIVKNKMSVFTETLAGKISYNYTLDKEYDNITFCLNPSLLKEIIKQKDFKCYFDLETKLYFMNENYSFICMLRKDEK